MFQRPTADECASLTPRPPSRDAPRASWQLKPKCPVPVQCHGPYQLRPVILWPSVTSSDDAPPLRHLLCGESSPPFSHATPSSVLPSHLSLEALVDLVSWRSGSVANPVEIARAVVRRAIDAAANAGSPDSAECCSAPCGAGVTASLGYVHDPECVTQVTCSDPAIECNAGYVDGTLPLLVDGEDSYSFLLPQHFTSAKAIDDENESCPQGASGAPEPRESDTHSIRVPAENSESDSRGPAIDGLAEEIYRGDDDAADGSSGSAEGPAEEDRGQSIVYASTTLIATATSLSSAWIDLDTLTSNVRLDELRCRHMISDAEALHWLRDVVAPAESERYSEPLCRFFTGAMAHGDEEVAELRSRRERFRIHMCRDLFDHVVALESVQRAFDVVDVEAAARSHLCDLRCQEVRVLRGLDPMRSALRRWMHRRRSRRAAAERRWRYLLGSEETQRRDVVNAYVHETSALASAVVTAEEVYYRVALLHVYAATVTATAHTWVWLHQRCSLFTLCFAHVLLGAPKMSGRVCNVSLFHTLSMRESFLRERVHQEERAFRLHVSNLVVAVDLALSVEPVARHGIVEEETNARDVLVSLFVHVTRMHQRRDVEHAEHDERVWLELQWRRTVESVISHRGAWAH